MSIEEKRIDFLDALKRIKNHMNWCKIKVDPDEKEEITDSRIQKDYVKSWKIGDDSISDKINKLDNLKQLSLIDLIIYIHFEICKYFVFDEFCYFLGKYDKERNLSLIDKKYGRNPSDKWIEARKKHNRRICFELSRYFAFRIKQFNNDKCDVFLVSDEFETHFAVGVICDDFMITIDTDDYIKGADLHRVKLGLKMQGITIVSDEKQIVENAIEKVNANRKSKKTFEREAEQDIENRETKEWIEILLDKIKIIGNDGIFKFANMILEFKGFTTQKIWEKQGDIYIQTLYIPWNMGFMVINSMGIETLSEKEFFDRIQEKRYIPNKDRHMVLGDYEYDG